MAVPARIRNQASLTALLLLAACAGGPQPADWQLNAVQATQAFERHYLAGDTRAAQIEFGIARRELARTGRADLVARAELRRCAVRTASLEFDGCPAFEALREGAGREELAYAGYLQGRGAHSPSKEPLSRLVAHAVHLKRGQIPPADIAAAVEIASAQGWRRPLLAWLGVQAKRAEDAGERESAARIRRRMALISG